jgi:hypothetical protein
MTFNEITTQTQLLHEIITESDMTDDNTCPCCLSDIQITISETTLADLIELLDPRLLPLLRARLEKETRKF